jgi:hypothetical protein
MGNRHSSEHVSDQRLYDCVRRYGPVTAKQVSKITGVTITAVLVRLNRDPRVIRIGVPLMMPSAKKTGRTRGVVRFQFVVKGQ